MQHAVDAAFPKISFFDTARADWNCAFEEIEGRAQVKGATVAIRRYGRREPSEGVVETESFYFELSLERRGWVVARGANERHYNAPGRIVFMPPSTSLRARCGPNDHRALCVLVSPARARTVVENEDMPFCPDVRDQNVGKVMLRLLKEVREPGFASELMVDSLVTGLMIEVARHVRGKAEPEVTGQLAAWRLRRLKERIEADLGNLSVSALAEECGISARHLIRTFKNTEGLTLSEYIAQRRLQRAHEMLRASDALIKEIAHACGFQSTSSFSTAFRRETGHTPKEFRQRLLQFAPRCA